MVFGTTYCPVSRLPIQDGDECVFIALEFSLKANSKFDVNNFTKPFVFAAIEPIVVIYNGNPSNINFKGKHPKTKNYELNMLVHKRFYELVVTENVKREYFSTIRGFQDSAGFLWGSELYQKVCELELENRIVETQNKLNPEKQQPLKELEKWMIDLATFANLVEWIGALTPVSFVVDQVDRQYSFFLRCVRLASKKKK